MTRVLAQEIAFDAGQRGARQIPATDTSGHRHVDAARSMPPSDIHLPHLCGVLPPLPAILLVVEAMTEVAFR